MPGSVTMAGLTPEPTPLRPGCPLCRRHRSSRNRFWGPVRGPSVPCRALWAEMLRMGREEKQEEKKTDPAWEGAEPKNKKKKLTGTTAIKKASHSTAAPGGGAGQPRPRPPPSEALKTQPSVSPAPRSPQDKGGS